MSGLATPAPGQVIRARFYGARAEIGAGGFTEPGRPPGAGNCRLPEGIPAGTYYKRTFPTRSGSLILFGRFGFITKDGRGGNGMCWWIVLGFGR